MTKNEYNGWFNYETWCVNLWMDNDEGSQGYWAERAQEYWDNTLDSEDRKHAAVCDLADEIKRQHDEYMDGDVHGIQGTVLADLLNAALSEVNWREIAEHLIEEVDKDE